MGLIVMLNDMVLNIYLILVQLMKLILKLVELMLWLEKTVLESPHLVKFCIVF